MVRRVVFAVRRVLALRPTFCLDRGIIAELQEMG